MKMCIDFYCHGYEKKPSDAVGSRPSNDWPSVKKRNLSLDAGRQFSNQEDKENQQNTVNADDQARQQKMPLQVNVAQREHINRMTPATIRPIFICSLIERSFCRSVKMILFITCT